MLTRFFKLTLVVLLAILLTVLTQVGGLVLLVCQPIFYLLDRRMPWRWLPWKTLTFVGLYAITSLWVVPPLAARFGRVPMPFAPSAEVPVQPLNRLTCLLNRHYVRQELKTLVVKTAQQMNEQYPGSTLVYLDACFPFRNGFPLIPHLSHNDGKKIDLAFYYTDTRTGRKINGDAPAWLGYGVCEAPRPQEENQPRTCEQRGYWQYTFVSKMVDSRVPSRLSFDAERTRALLKLLATRDKTDKIFIEAHLKQRLKLTSAKIRRPGCHAVRHDDHIHLQLK